MPTLLTHFFKRSFTYTLLLMPVFVVIILPSTSLEMNLSDDLIFG